MREREGYWREESGENVPAKSDGICRGRKEKEEGEKRRMLKAQTCKRDAANGWMENDRERERKRGRRQEGERGWNGRG